MPCSVTIYLACGWGPSMKSMLVVLVAALAGSGCQPAAAPKEVTKNAKISQAEEACDAPADGTWLPTTAAPSYAAIADDADDCDFYKAAWQNFLYATDAGGGAQPAFLAYPGIEDLFGKSAAPLLPARTAGLLSVSPRVAKLPNDFAFTGGANIGSGIRQAGLRGVLTDAEGKPIYYSIHVSPSFKTFINNNGLTTAPALIAADPELSFPGGIVEYKAAWKVVDASQPPAGFITTAAVVPTISLKAGDLVVDPTKPRQVTLALIAFHVAFTLDNHPEMIWATFQHTGPNGATDLAPSAEQLPPGTQTIKDPAKAYLLFQANTAVSDALQPADAVTFNVGAQKFSKPTAVYRVYPASKGDTLTPDEAVDALNESAAGVFASGGLDKKDKRFNYHLVGAVWLKHPRVTFKVGSAFANPVITKPTDDIDSILSGEGAMSSTAMESFTQIESPNCFSCHDTRKVIDDASGAVILTPKKLNVSHVLSRFLSEKK